MDSLSLTIHQQKQDLWLSRISACRESDQTVVAWCTEQNINIKSYYYWMRKLKREAFDSLPIERKPKITSVMNTSFSEISNSVLKQCHTTAILIKVGNVMLEIQNGADPSTIENTLHAIKSLC